MDFSFHYNNILSPAPDSLLTTLDWFISHLMSDDIEVDLLFIQKIRDIALQGDSKEKLCAFEILFLLSKKNFFSFDQDLLDSLIPFFPAPISLQIFSQVSSTSEKSFYFLVSKGIIEAVISQLSTEITSFLVDLIGSFTFLNWESLQQIFTELFDRFSSVDIESQTSIVRVFKNFLLSSEETSNWMIEKGVSFFLCKIEQIDIQLNVEIASFLTKFLSLQFHLEMIVWIEDLSLIFDSQLIFQCISFLIELVRLHPNEADTLFDFSFPNFFLGIFDFDFDVNFAIKTSAISFLVLWGLNLFVFDPFLRFGLFHIITQNLDIISSVEDALVLFLRVLSENDEAIQDMIENGVIEWISSVSDSDVSELLVQKLSEYVTEEEVD